jgi:hypothetical protein
MMTVLHFDIFPSLEEEGTMIVQTDKEHFRAPAETVADMDGRGFTAGHPLIAMRAGMDLIKIAFVAT